MGLSLPVFPLGWQPDLPDGLVTGAAVVLLYGMSGGGGNMRKVFCGTWSFILQTSFFLPTHLPGWCQWRLAYAAGLVLVTLGWHHTLSEGVALQAQGLLTLLVLSGFLMGCGARLGIGRLGPLQCRTQRPGARPAHKGLR